MSCIYYIYLHLHTLKRTKKKGIVCQTHWAAITLTKVRKDVTVNTHKKKKYKMPKRVFVHVWDYLVVVVVVH